MYTRTWVDESLTVVAGELWRARARIRLIDSVLVARSTVLTRRTAAVSQRTIMHCVIIIALCHTHTHTHTHTVSQSLIMTDDDSTCTSCHVVSQSTSADNRGLWTPGYLQCLIHNDNVMSTTELHGVTLAYRQCELRDLRWLNIATYCRGVNDQLAQHSCMCRLFVEHWISLTVGRRLSPSQHRLATKLTDSFVIAVKLRILATAAVDNMFRIVAVVRP